MKKIIYRLTLALSLGSVLLLVSSCSKQEDKLSTGTETQQERTQRKVKQLISKIPVMKLMHQARLQNGAGGNSGTPHTLDFTFSNANGTFTAVNGTNYTTIANTLYTAVSYTVYVAQNQFGANTGGGTVVAGATALDINYTFCFATAADGIGLDLFNTGNAQITGMSGVIGISGDFANFQNANDSTSFSDIFKGFAFYIVYDSPADGSYPVVNWQDDNLSDTTSNGIDKKCFTFILDFQNGRLFMSKSGSVTVTGGSMAFNGEYFAVEGFINDQGEFDLSGDNLTFSVVSGFGAMGCN